MYWIYRIVFFLARAAPVIVLLSILAFLYAAIISIPEMVGVDRTIGELAENIVHHNLTVDRAVFDPDELEKYDVSTAEPYVRHCQYGYYLEIEDLGEATTSCAHGNSQDCKDFCMDVCGLPEDELIFWQPPPDELYGNCACYSKVCQCREDITDEEGWRTGKSEAKFGYNPERVLYVDITIISDEEKGSFYSGNVKKEVTKDYYVSVADGDSVKPAKMTLTVSDTWLTRVSCLVEKAYYTQKQQNMPIDCLLLYPLTGASDCWLPIRKSGDNICIFHQNPHKIGGDIIKDIDCRSLPDMNILYFDYPYKGEKTLVAIPIKPSHGLSTDETPDASKKNCERIESNPSWVAGEGDDIDTVLLCIR